MQLTMLEHQRIARARRVLSETEQDDFARGIARWRKFGVTPAQWKKFLDNNADAGMARTPEGRLVLDMLCSAYEEADKSWYQSVVRGWPFNAAKLNQCRFFYEPFAHRMFAAVGIDPEFAIEQLRVATPWARIN
jgi:hypothetical protein